MNALTVLLCLLVLSPVPEPEILTRAEWGANPMVLTPPRHELRRITIHHTASRTNPQRTLEDKLRALQAFSQREDRLADGRVKPKWADIPYHFFVNVDGNIGECRDVAFPGDTNTPYDPTGHLLIVLEGNFMEEEVGEAQWRSLVQLTAWLAYQHRLSPINIQSHRDFTATLCPGDKLYERLPELREAVKRLIRPPR